MRRRVATGLGVLAAALAAAPAAHAGTYDVHSCFDDATGTAYDAGAWTVSPALNVNIDNYCGPKDNFIGAAIHSGLSAQDGSRGRLTFTAPAGSTIAGFSADRNIQRQGAPVAGHHEPYAAFVLDAPFTGAGFYDDDVRTRLNKTKDWSGYPDAEVNSGWGPVTDANYPDFARQAPTATKLEVLVGCFANGTTCAVPDGGLTRLIIRDVRVTINDPNPPALTVAATGLLAGGARSASDPITVSASDAGGIRRVQLLDVTGGGQVPVGGVDLSRGAGGKTTAGTACTDDRPAPCPDVANQPLTAGPLTVGTHSIVVRAVDAAGNVTDSPPYAVDVAYPSDRGALNGTGATDTAKLSAAFPVGKKSKGSRTVSYGSRPKVQGRLLNADGKPVAGAALHVSARDKGAVAYKAKGTVKTGTDGRFSFKLKATASRAVRIGWHSHVNDGVDAAAASVTLKTRATASLHAPRSVRVGKPFSITGRLAGVKPRSAISIVAQGKGSKGPWSTFALGRAKKGKFKVGYRFRSSASRGHTFKLRVRLLAKSGWPYETGTTKTVKVRVR